MTAIALTMIVRNEARCLARCLESVRPWVDRMVVVDTGSTDATVQIARECGAEVFHFDWIDDFAAARNAALAHADADWHLVLDADEWIVSGGEWLAGLREPHSPALFNIRVDSTLGNDQARVCTSNWLPRILPRGVRYRGRIHEQPAHGSLPVLNSPLVGQHDGYQPEQRAGKKDRNFLLLQLALQEHPDDPYLHFQIGKEYELKERHADAIPHYQRAFAARGGHSDSHHDLVLRLLECLRLTGRLQEAMMVAADEMPRWPHSPDFHFAVGRLLLDQMQAHPEQGASLLPMIEESWLKALEIGDQPDLPGSIRGHGSFITAEQLSGLYLALKQLDKAEHFRQRQQQDYEAWRHSLSAEPA